MNGLVVAAALATLLVTVLWILVRDLMLFAASRNWIETTGTIYQQREGWTVKRVWLRYAVNGMLFQSGRWYWLQAFEWLAISGLKAQADRDRQGEEVAIRYDPQAPHLAIPVSERAFPAKRVGWALLVIGLCAAGLWGALQPPPPSPMLPPELAELTPEQLAQIPVEYWAQFAVSPAMRLINPFLLPVRLAILGLLCWTLYEAWREFGSFAKYAHWPMHSAKIQSDVVRVASDGVNRPRRFRDVQYTYRVNDHRFEADRLTAFGTALDTGPLPVELPFPDGVEVGSVVSCWHRPGRPGQSMLLHDKGLLTGAITVRVLTIVARIIVLIACAESLEVGSSAGYVL